MIARKIIIAAALLASATSAALAQSEWTSGSAADRAHVGYSSTHRGGLYDYAPGYVSRQNGDPAGVQNQTNWPSAAAMGSSR